MKNKEFSTRAIRHGELILIPVATISGLEEVYSGNEYLLSHSESGHHHVAVGDLTVYRPTGADDGTTYLRANEDLRIEHRKTHDKHETKTLFRGLYTVVIKKEYDYFTNHIRPVRD